MHDFVPVAVPQPIPVKTGVDVGVTTMVKQFEGEVLGRSATLFTSAYSPELGGTYVAMESFEGSLNGADGTFNFAHAASTRGTDRADESFVIVPASGTGELAGITGSGGIRVDDDGTHRVWFDYELS